MDDLLETLKRRRDALLERGGRLAGATRDRGLEALGKVRGGALDWHETVAARRSELEERAPSWFRLTGLQLLMLDRVDRVLLAFGERVRAEIQRLSRLELAPSPSGTSGAETRREESGGDAAGRALTAGPTSRTAKANGRAAGAKERDEAAARADGAAGRKHAEPEASAGAAEPAATEATAKKGASKAGETAKKRTAASPGATATTATPKTKGDAKAASKKDHRTAKPSKKGDAEAASKKGAHATAERSDTATPKKKGDAKAASKKDARATTKKGAAEAASKKGARATTKKGAAKATSKKGAGKASPKKRTEASSKKGAGKASANKGASSKAKGGRGANGASRRFVMPIADYDALTAKEVLAELPRLSAAQRETIYEHEKAHKKRKTVLRALEARDAS